MWWHKLGEVENEYTSHNFSLFAIFLPKSVKIGGHLTKFWQKQFCTVFLRHGVDFIIWDDNINIDFIISKTTSIVQSSVAIWLSGSMLVLISEVTLRQVRLVMGYVTGLEFSPGAKTYLSI